MLRKVAYNKLVMLTNDQPIVSITRNDGTRRNVWMLRSLQRTLQKFQPRSVYYRQTIVNDR